MGEEEEEEGGREGGVEEEEEEEEARDGQIHSQTVRRTCRGREREGGREGGRKSVRYVPLVWKHHLFRMLALPPSLPPYLCLVLIQAPHHVNHLPIRLLHLLLLQPPSLPPSLPSSFKQRREGRSKSSSSSSSSSRSRRRRVRKGALDFDRLVPPPPVLLLLLLLLLLLPPSLPFLLFLRGKW
jgi:hypothetical protein